MDAYYDLLTAARTADVEESQRIAELNATAQVAHERASVAVAALNAFDTKAVLGTCGHCAAARGELVALEHREREQSLEAERNLRSCFHELRHGREQRHEALAQANERDKRRLCAHADENGRGMHWLEAGERCTDADERNESIDHG